MIWRERLLELADKIAKATGSKTQTVFWILLKEFSLAEKKPTDSFAESIFGKYNKSK